MIFLRFSFGIGRRRMGGRGRLGHSFCRRIRLRLRGRMEGRVIPSPSAFTSISLTSASLTVLPLPPSPPTVLTKAVSVVFIIVSLTTMHTPPVREGYEYRQSPLLVGRHIWQRIEFSSPPHPLPRSYLPPLLLPFLR